MSSSPRRSPTPESNKSSQSRFFLHSQQHSITVPTKQSKTIQRTLSLSQPTSKFASTEDDVTTHQSQPAVLVSSQPASLDQPFQLDDVVKALESGGGDTIVLHPSLLFANIDARVCLFQAR